MLQAPIPANEEQRMNALHALNILDTPPEERFDRITKIATKFFNTPISTVTMVDANRQWFKSCVGLPGREGARGTSFCGHAILQDEPLVIPDALKDERFADNPLVTGEPNIRFYAGVALSAPDGSKVGTLCIIDRVPHDLDADHIQILVDMAKWAEMELNTHNLSQALEERRKAGEQLKEQNVELEKLNNMMVDRELKMIELKNKIAELESKNPSPTS